jgi:erythronate-4-phosphate dehydrogenase
VNIIVDRNIRAAEETFGRHARLRFMDGRAIGNRDLKDIDALIIRTTTRVDEALLRDTPVRFVGSTSIGTDHMDTVWLRGHGIAWANAPGCNADSAAQYTLAMIWLACERLGRRLHDLTAGIIGRGNVGSRVLGLLQSLGIRAVANDPPLADAGVSGLVPLEEALAKDIVCLHVPLTRDGPNPTHRFIGPEELARMPDHALLVNTARGDVVAGQALLSELQAGRLEAALDVWPGEPLIDADLLRATTVATPHVAGYSDDGKRLGTLMVYDSFCRWAGLAPPPVSGAPEYPKPLRIEAGADTVTEALDAACFVRTHDTEMRKLASLTLQERARSFDRLRRDYPLRRDFHAWQVITDDREATEMLRRLGFRASAPNMPSTA